MNWIQNKISKLLVLLLTCASVSIASGLTLVAHPSVTLDSVTKVQLKRIFLGKIKKIGSQSFKPVNCKAFQKTFFKEFLGKSQSKYKKYWLKKTFADGAKSPEVKSGLAELMAYISSTPGAIGYAPADQVSEVKRLRLE
jgi:ABC-type phosphate transport system substrate-binding protein